MRDENITGAYMRTYRDEHWQNIDIACLTDDELNLLEKALPDKGWMWAKFLVGWIRDNVVTEDDNTNDKRGHQP